MTRMLILLALAAAPPAADPGLGAPGAAPSAVRESGPATGADRERSNRALAPAPAVERLEFAELARRAGEARARQEYEGAIALYRRALALHPRWEEGLWHLGIIEYDLDQYAGARDAFAAFVRLEPEAGAAWAFLAFCEHRLARYQLAREHIGRALALGVGSYEDLHRVAHYHAGILMNRFGDFEQAYASLEKLAKVGDRDAKVSEALGINLLRLHYLPDELPVDKRELVLLAGRAAYAQAAGRPAEAKLHYAELLARFGESPNVHYAHGVFLLAADTDAAMLEFRREIEISPAHVEARLQLAYQYLKRGEYHEARPHALSAVRLAPTLFTARNAYGRVLLATGEAAQAVEQLELARMLEPGSAPVRFALAQAYQRAGREQQAERERQAFQELDAIRRAIDQGEQEVRQTPGDAEAHRRLADAYERSRRPAEARRERRIAEQVEKTARGAAAASAASRGTR